MEDKNINSNSIPVFEEDRQNIPVLGDDVFKPKAPVVNTPAPGAYVPPQHKSVSYVDFISEKQQRNVETPAVETTAHVETTQTVEEANKAIPQASGVTQTTNIPQASGVSQTPNMPVNAQAEPGGAVFSQHDEPHISKPAVILLVILIGLVLSLASILVVKVLKGFSFTYQSVKTDNNGNQDYDSFSFGKNNGKGGSSDIQPPDTDIQPQDDVNDDYSVIEKDLDSMLSGSQSQSADVDWECYDMANDIKDNLDYQVEMAEYEYFSEDGLVKVQIEYPVVTGNADNIDMIAKAASREADYWIDIIEDTYINSTNAYGSDFASVYIKGYVTYMSDEILSIAYSENISSYGSSSARIISTNIDIASGITLDNSQMLNLDIDFASDFMERSEKQNGSSALNTYEPEYVYDCLTNNDSLIVFYTPIGLEIGINHSMGWTTVSYPEYEQYLNSY